VQGAFELLGEFDKSDIQVSKQPEDGIQPGSVPPVDAEIEPFPGDSGFEARRD
jgi:hypothetical protein